MLRIAAIPRLCGFGGLGIRIGFGVEGWRAWVLGLWGLGFRAAKVSIKDFGHGFAGFKVQRSEINIKV